MKAIAFMIRGCPAGWLGAYGNEWVGTPQLDRLAAESVVFDRHISDCPGGVLPSGSRLIEVLRAANVRCVLIRANHPDTDHPASYYAGWDEVFDARPVEADKSPLDALIRTLPKLLDRLADVPDFQLWIETDRLLPPWDVPQDVFEAYLDVSDDEEDEPDEEDEEEDTDDETDDEEQGDEAPEPAPDADRASPADESVTPWADPPTGPAGEVDPDAREWLFKSFAAVVTTLDAELGVVFDQLRGRGLDQSAAWLVTSDFGYPLGEHGQIGMHRPWLYEELVHLPLILQLPGAVEACRRVYGFTQPQDIAPTLLDLLGVKLPADMPGFNLLPLARGEVEVLRPHAITALELGDAAERAIRTDDWTFLLPVRVPPGETREPQLFERPDDRCEVNDLRTRNIERADELEAELKKPG
jgi:arylsulfatase A-like enzyme